MVFIAETECVLCDIIVEAEERAEHVASTMIDCKKLLIGI